MKVSILLSLNHNKKTITFFLSGASKLHEFWLLSWLTEQKTEWKFVDLSTLRKKAEKREQMTFIYFKS